MMEMLSTESMVDDDVEQNDVSQNIIQGLHNETVSDDVGMEKADDTTNVSGETTIIDPGKELSIQGGVEMNNATPLEGSSVIFGEQNIEQDGETLIQDLLTAVDFYITNLDGTKSLIKQEEATMSKKTLGIHDSPAGGNTGHLDHIKMKATPWVNRMTNGHLPSHMARVAYKHQLWPGL